MKYVAGVYIGLELS